MVKFAKKQLKLSNDHLKNRGPEINVSNDRVKIDQMNRHFRMNALKMSTRTDIVE